MLFMMDSFNLLEVNGIRSSEPIQQLLFTMIRLGVQSHVAKCLVCLHLHGPSSSIKLQKNCNIRQPNVSVAITELKRLKVVKSDSSASTGRGRPSHIYQLTGTLEECIIPFIEEAKNKISTLVSAIATLEDLVQKKKI
jgi:predicted transcriptional regulator|tara:strand:+ start:488 stop:901 length:414 start_codon:yes stop_codon:yes gene_type:complete